MKTLLWLDDIRNPFVGDWLLQYASEFAYGDGEVIWVKTYDEFCDWIELNGLPNTIAFDHDLSDFQSMKSGYPEMMECVPTPPTERTGMDCAKFLVEYCMDENELLPDWVIQSANEVGKENIDKFLKNYLKHQTQ